LVSDNTEKVQSVDLIRVDRENLPVVFLSSLPAPRPMVLDGNR